MGLRLPNLNHHPGPPLRTAGSYIPPATWLSKMHLKLNITFPFLPISSATSSSQRLNQIFRHHLHLLTHSHNNPPATQSINSQSTRFSPLHLPGHHPHLSPGPLQWPLLKLSAYSLFTTHRQINYLCKMGSLSWLNTQLLHSTSKIKSTCYMGWQSSLLDGPLPPPSPAPQIVPPTPVT